MPSKSEAWPTKEEDLGNLRGLSAELEERFTAVEAEVDKPETDKVENEEEPEEETDEPHDPNTCRGCGDPLAILVPIEMTREAYNNLRENVNNVQYGSQKQVQAAVNDMFRFCRFVLDEAEKMLWQAGHAFQNRIEAFAMGDDDDDDDEEDG